MLFRNQQWISDIDRLFENFLDLSFLKNRKILITGATGLICSAVVDILLRYNDLHENKIQIYVAGRNQVSMERRFASSMYRDDFTFVHYDATKGNNQFDFQVDYIIHGAGNAFPSKVMKEPVETMIGNFLGLKELLDYAKKTKAERVLYISSSEVYGQKMDLTPYLETEYGYIDLLNSRNSYAVGKRAAETLCSSYKEEYGVNSVIVRPGHVYGPTASRTDTRVSSQWPYIAVLGKDIVMKSDGSQIRSYCYCLDCASAILTVLHKGKNNRAYNISNPDSVISIKQMATLIAKNAGIRLISELPTGEEKKAFNPMSNSSLASIELLRLGWKGIFSAEEGIKHTIDIIRESEC